jgi:resolvase-like protein
MRAALYARVSTEKQGRDQTIDSQLEALRAWAVAHGHEVGKEHVSTDEGYSGSRLDRPALDRLRDAARGGEFEVVAVYSPDRLARRYAYQVLLLEEFRRDEVVDRILEADVVLQVVLPPGVRQRLAHQPPVALAGGQVVPLHVRGVDLRAAAIRLQDPDEIVLGAEEELPLDFDHASPFAALTNSRVAQIRVHQASRLLARTARTTSRRRRLRGAVVGDQCGDIRRQWVACEEGSPAIGPGLELGQKRTRFLFAAVVAEVADHAQPAGQGQGAPDPHVADVGGVVRLAVGLLFLTKVQSSSIWTWVRDKSRMSAELTEAPCCPAKASQCRTRFGEWRVRRAAALRLLRSANRARASSTVARGQRRVSKNVCLSALNVRRHVAQS